MIDFSHSTLYISLRSPFARRVRLALIENDIPYKEEVMDVFNPPKDFEKVNPLLRIPVLKTAQDEVIIDSNMILEGIYLHKPDSSLIPQSSPGMLLALKWSGLAFGICEFTVARYLETLRPTEKQSEEALKEYDKNLGETLAMFDSYIGRKNSIVEQGITQADLDMGAALGYYALRIDSAWGETYPNAFQYFTTLSQRPSFKKTNPPSVS